MTFRSKYRWLNLLLGLVVFAISISGILRGYPFHAINLLTSSLLISQALLWRVSVSSAGLKIFETWGWQRRSWEDFSHVEVIQRFGQRIVCLVHRPHVPDRRGWGIWWLPAHLRRRSTILLGHWEHRDRLEGLVIGSMPRLPGDSAPAGAWFVPAAPPVEDRGLVWQILGYGSALALAAMFIAMILF